MNQLIGSVQFINSVQNDIHYNHHKIVIQILKA